MQQAHVFISGKVQGVSYRYFVLQNAKELGLNGWVRNTNDGRVEVVFQGEKVLIDQILERCKSGPTLSEVIDVAVIWENTKTELEGFTIRS